MATMVDVPGPAPAAGPSPDDGDGIFGSLVGSASAPNRARRGLAASAAIHTVVITAAVLLPILWPEPLPDQIDVYRVLIYNPPPPPPPPLPKGSAAQPQTEPAKPVTPDETPRKPDTLFEPQEPKDTPLEAEARDKMSDQFGSPTGSDMGVAEGMEGGVEGGVVGGVLGGVLGGVVGGTGDGPVMDYDQPPRAIKITKPQYPQEAFVKKVEGTVVLEILIDQNGKVIRARVLQSIPLLDSAAIETVKQWVFKPAIKNGRPVATVANAPVGFRIF